MEILEFTKLIENNLKYKFSSWYQDGSNRAIRDVQPKSYGCILILSSKLKKVADKKSGWSVINLELLWINMKEIYLIFLKI